MANKIISQARLIITDQLQASIVCFLMGKLHIMLDDSNRLLWNTRENAFVGKAECAKEFVRGHYVKNIDQAVEKAVSLLNQEK